MHTSIAIDKVTRDRAAKRAHGERMPLAVVVRILLNEYADGRLSIGTRAEQVITTKEIPVDATTRKKMNAAVFAWRARLAK